MRNVAAPARPPIPTNGFDEALRTVAFRRLTAALIDAGMPFVDWTLRWPRLSIRARTTVIFGL
ncbi:hypothetical protein [Parasphingopyxis marina]|uniref:Uncharacterized protein n=1 Tax=Parasphingopyxis marina TaxID=2761622 RepID=A0A842HU99_9SPHN|nr:hypothetical protein [Parasphingopyxis marina]MBC2776505.1 hypothetical protein [Parasphingopyxis marina]